MAMFDLIFQFGAVVASAIKAETLEITGQVLGIGGLDGGEGESSPGQPMYGPLGMLARPLPPDTSSGKTHYADVVCLKTADGLLPIAWRDLRINRAFPAGVKEGTIAFAGYGGGFYSLDLTSVNSGSQKANIHVIYCPYAYDGNGTPTKAHAIMLDPTSGNESINITHGEGYQLSLTQDSGFNLNIDANTWLNMKPGLFMVNAAKCILQGNCSIGASAAAGVPLLPGVASPPSPSTFVSSV